MACGPDLTMHRNGSDSMTQYLVKFSETVQAHSKGLEQSSSLKHSSKLLSVFAFDMGQQTSKVCELMTLMISYTVCVCFARTMP